MSHQLLASQSEEQLPETREEFLSRQFYEWEGRGRGWLSCPYAVELEPPFRSFSLAAPSNYEIADDGRTSTFLSRLADSFRGSRSSGNQSLARAPKTIDESAEPAPAYCTYADEDFGELQIVLPEGLKVTRPVAEQLLLSLSYCRYPISFEVVGTQDATTIQLAAAARDVPQVKAQLQAHLPEAVILENADTLLAAWNQGEGGAVTVDFGLSREFLLPLEIVSSFDTDPLVAAAGALANLSGGETGVLQVLFCPARFPWAEEMLDAVRNFDGSPFFINAPEMLPLTKQKVSRPLFAVVVRVAAKSYHASRAWQIVRNLGSAFAALSNPMGNELIPLSNDGYDSFDHEQCLLLRQSHRPGMLLNSEELVSLVHPPSAAVRTEKLVRDARKTKSAPAMALHHSLVLGTNEHQGSVREAGLSLEQRAKHVHLIGTSGSGKSTLLLNMIRQDMEAGDGIAVFDPHGDLVDDVLAHIPEHRLKDVVLFDPSDSEYPIGFNPLQANSEAEKTLLASDLVATFRRFSTSWGDVMDAVLANAILAILESSKGGTLFDLKRLLVEKEFRREFLQTVDDDGVRYFWQHEYAALAGRSQSSILVRLDTFLRQKLVRNIVCQKKSRLNFREIMDRQKILLVRLAQGSIGEENSYLLGTLLVSKLHQIALSRQDTEKEKRAFFGIYLDEFHHFITPSMETLLSGVRKYNIGLTLAHQEFRQLQSRNAEVAQSVLSNCYTRVCFRLGDADAERFASGFGFFDAAHLQNLGVGEAIARIERSEFDFNLQTALAPEIARNIVAAKKREIVRLSREQFAVVKSVVENDFSSWRNDDSTGGAADADTNRSERKIENENRAASGSSRVEATTKPPVKTANGQFPSPPPAPFDAHTGNHRYLQSLVKKIGERNGFLATIEKPVFGGAGKIDVALERGDLKVACEISVTTPADYELQNIQKCLAAGYNPVIVASADEKHLLEIQRKAAEQLGGGELANVVFLAPDALAGYLESLISGGRHASNKDSVEITAETTKGYAVKVAYASAEKPETKSRTKAVADTILNLIRRKKK